MWRPTWRRGASWRCQMWRQNVASLAHVRSGSQVVARCGVKTWRHLPNVASGSQVASPDVASKRDALGVTCPRSQPAGAVPAFMPMASPGVVEPGVKTWRHLLTWHQKAMWRRWTWCQNVASGAIDLRGGTGRRVNTWRQEAQASRHVSSKWVFSHRVICAPPQATSL